MPARRPNTPASVGPALRDGRFAHDEGAVAAAIAHFADFLVGKDTRLPDYLILVSTLGGLALLGLNGFVIGPLVAALFVASWNLLGTKKKVRLPE